MQSINKNIETAYEVLERSVRPINKQAFYALYGLTRKRTWLERKANQLIELWDLCDTDDQKNLILDLLDRFKYLAGSDIDDSCQALAEIVTSDWKCDPNNTRLVAIASDEDPDGSQSVLQCLKNYLTEADGWKIRRFHAQLDDALEKTRPASVLILVEDFVGTGDKIEKALSKAMRNLKAAGIEDVKICSLFVSAMKQAIPKLDDLGITYACVHWLDRGISDHYRDVDLTSAIAAIKGLSAKLSKRYNGQFMNPLGRKKSESIVYLESISVPNNVFPIFWWPTLSDGTRRSPLFVRQR